MTVRAATAADARPIAEACAGQPLLQRYGVTVDGLITNLRRAVERGEGLLVAEDEGGVLGFAWFLVRGTLATGGYLRLIALRPGAESRGVGVRLLRAVEAEVAGESRVLFLLVSEPNTGAQRFYEREGYARVGPMADLVKDGVTELLYWKKLAL